VNTKSPTRFFNVSGAGIDCALSGSELESHPVSQVSFKPMISIPDSKFTDFCQRHHIRRLSLFGSVLREDFGPDSDIDVLVEFEPGQTPGFIGLYDLEEELSALLGGRKIDLVTVKSLHPQIRAHVLAEAQVQYDKG
jgi:uncharacterized protein